MYAALPARATGSGGNNGASGPYHILRPVDRDRPANRKLEEDPMQCARRLLLGLAIALAVPAALPAQDGFLFRQPAVTVSLRFGQSLPSVGGELFDRMRQDLTLDRGDFRTEAFAADVLIHINPRFDIGTAFQWTQSATDSEYRDLVYDDGEPIRQTTKLRRVPLTVQARYYPIARGESIAQYAWVPVRFTPFVGAGAGVMWYELNQQGDFVDDSLIYGDELVSRGSALAVQAMAGADYWVTPVIALTAEGRYTFAKDDPSGDFDYSSVDLGGLQLSAGFSIRF
jgi:opacity protein-like surface antigen